MKKQKFISLRKYFMNNSWCLWLKSNIKRDDHDFYGKINIFPVKSTAIEVTK